MSAPPSEAPSTALAAAISDLSRPLLRSEPEPSATAERLAGALLGAVIERWAEAGCADALGFPSSPPGVDPGALPSLAAVVAQAHPPALVPLPGRRDDAGLADLAAGPLGAAYTTLLGREARWGPGGLVFHDAGGRRRAAGAWYTPPELIDALLDRALDPVAVGEDARGEPPARPVVLDPSCGSGRFLLAAARRLRAHHGARAHPASLLAERAVRGWDRDPLAAALARAALWLEAGASIDPWEARAAIEVRDALTGPRAPDPASTDELEARAPRDGAARLGCADAVLGNPPHGGAMTRAERRALAGRYPPARRAGNTAAAFCVRAHELTRADGRVGLVLPKALTYAHTWAPLRSWLEPTILDVVDVTTAWPDVRLEQVLLTTRPKGRAHDEPAGRAHEQQGVRLSRWQQPPRSVAPALIRRIGTLPTGLDADDERLLDHLERRTALRLGELVRTVRGGAAQPWTRPCGGDDHRPTDAPVLGGRDLAPLRAGQPSRVLDTVACPPHHLRRTQPPQAVFQNIVAHRTRPADHACLIGTVITEPTACLDTVNLLVPRVAGVPPWGLAAVLLSHLSSWFVHVVCYNRAVRTMHFDNVVLARVPLPDPALLAALDPVGRAISAAPDDAVRWHALEDAVAEAWALPSAARERLAATHLPRA